MFHKKVFHSLHSHSSCCLLDLRRMLFMVISHAVRPVRSLPSHSQRSVCARMTAAESEPSEKHAHYYTRDKSVVLYQLLLCSLFGWFGDKSLFSCCAACFILQLVNAKRMQLHHGATMQDFVRKCWICFWEVRLRFPPPTEKLLSASAPSPDSC